MILLLDIDGVLETSPSWKQPEFLEDKFYKFNENRGGSGNLNNTYK